MTWRDDLQPASFRGVAFKVESSDTSGGRRLAEHEYPGRDVPFIEDLGRSAREFTLEAYVIGEDYFTGRDALIEALETAGAGELVHPYQGAKNVVVKAPFRMRETRGEGGMARFSITFMEVGEQENPTASVDEKISIESATADLIASAKTKFVETLEMTGVPEFVRNAAGGQLSTFTDALAAVEVGIAEAQTLAGYYRQVQAFAANPVGSLLNKLGFADGYADLMGLASLVSGGGKSSVREMGKIYNVPQNPSEGTTDTQAIADANRAAIVEFSRALTVAYSANAAQDAEYESFEDAVGTRDEVIEQVDAEMETASFEVFEALQGVRATLVEVVPSQTEQLPRLQTVTLADSQPDLVVAYDLYEDIERSNEIVRRNNQRHPGFLDTGVPLEVLSDV